jgi:hypothetical protein
MSGSPTRPAPIAPDALHGATAAELKERLVAERGGRPFLLYRDAGGAQHIREFGDGGQRLTIGRSAANDVALPWDVRVSRVHGHLERLGDAWTFVDDGLARNGSFIDGERVSGRTRLRDGCAILVGSTLVVFRSPAAGDSSRTAVAPGPVVPRVSEAQLRVLSALCRPCVASPVSVPATNQEIADELVIGFETVKSHLKVLFELFELDELPHRGKRAALAQRAIALGIVAPYAAPS